jgi:hypothetical protein
MTHNKTASWLSKYITDPVAHAMPYGKIEQNAAAAQAQANVGPQAEAAKQMGETLLKYTLGGVGAGLSASKLYNLVSSLNQPKQKHTKFGPGAKTVDDDEKMASMADIYNTVVSAPGKLVQGISSDPKDQNAAFTAALLGGTGLGVLGGSSLMSSIVAKKRKEELKDQVEEAKAEYQKALTGKRAAADFDAAFDTYVRVRNSRIADAKQAGMISDAVSGAGSAISNLGANALKETVKSPFTVMKQVPGVFEAYVASALGLAGLSGKMTYDWTRARGKDKAIENAQKARARLSGVAPIYVDPEQLAAIKQIAD